MTGQPFVLGADVRQLLGQIALDPKSRLFRTAAPRRLLEPGTVSDGEPFLTRAERHLLAQYRDEVAYLLRDAARTAILNERSTGTLLVRAVPAMERPTLADAPHLARSARRLLDSPLGQPETTAAIALVTAMATEGEQPTPEALAAAALRLVPSDTARLLYAQGLCASAQNAAARRRFLAVASQSSNRTEVSIAWETLGLLEARSNDDGQALEAYKAAWRANPDRWGPIVWWLATASRLEAREELLEADRALASTPTPPGCAESTARVLRETQGWTTNASLADAVQSETGRRIIDALI